MSQLSVNDHLEGILSDFEALKRSFDMEDAEEAPAVPPSCPFSPSTPADSLAAGNRESGQLASLTPPTYQSRISLSSSPSPAQSPVLKTRISTSFSFNRGTIHLARANGAVSSSLTRVASFQARLDPNGFSSSLGPGSESLHSSSSSLECPPPPSTPQSAARQPEPRGLKAAPVTSPALKKFSSHSNVFHSEAEQPVQLVSKAGVNHGSLPSLDLHIAEDQGSPIPLTPALAFHSAGAWSSNSQNCALLRGKSSTPISREPSFSSSSSSSSSSPLSDAAQRPSLSPAPPPSRRPPKLQKFPISLDGLMGKPLDGSDPAPSADSVSRLLPRTQLQLSLSTSPSLSRQPPGSSPEPGCISMEGQPVQPVPEETPRNANPANVGLELFGYVGIEAVLDQMRIKTMKTGFEFNLMVVGQSGLGKSTMVNTLFKSKVSRKPTGPGYEEHVPKTVQLQSVTHVIEEKGVKMKLTVTDTPGFGDQINNENCWDPIIKYINEQYEKYLREEILISRKQKIPDTRVHSCVYFVPPTGHWLRPLDLEFMRRLSKIVNMVPVIAKADTLTLEERAEFKQRIQKDLKAHGISVYPQEDFDDNPDDRILNNKIRDKIPFAVVGADKEHQVNGKRVLGRKTKWGIIEVENPAHCEFPLLRDLLIRSHLQDLKDITHNVHYESYRVQRLNESNQLALSPVNGLLGKDEVESNL
ncbi:Septin-9 [Chelonia mydas]|uniref:Septin-9 n=1 Tax=Chelonia mydas TaxID=8469 RepID=M7BUN9_CHEMY|nr:Septin-9 [Chelonia mydas]